ncbi:tape-measure protein [Streptomyces sp. P9(2023)]|uniref:tape-measure protein n=1 Tax=Streptomyces sp. P9(2023) TaxID=3064394 RepID=UPI0028F3E64C|nr:tape-measure protein [Streptomyces sp. P9(2023)]MDT9688576.1 tape-measure protein [Streptomyces sp. P9(2023)]
MSAAAAGLNPFAGAAPAFASVQGALRPAVDGLKRLKQDAQRAAGGIGTFAAGLRSGGTSVRTLGTNASGAATSVRRIQRSTGAAGVKRIGDAAAKARTAAGKFGPAIGGILAILAPLLPVTDVITKLMDTYGTVMTIASVAMTGVNVAMRANPLGFLVGILVPVAAWLIEYAVNSETGRRIIRQVFQQALKGFQSVWKFLQPLMKLLGQAVGTYFKAYLTLFTTALKIVGSGINGLSKVRAAVTSASNALRGIASRTIGSIKNAVKPVLSFITDKIPGFFRHAKDAVGKALGGMGELIKGALTAVIGVVKGPINGLIAFANWIIDGLNKLSFNILGKKFGVDLDKIPMLADGGVVFPGAADAPRIDPLAVLENRRVPALTEAPRPPHRIREFHEEPGAGPRSTAEDLLFLAASHR